MFIRSPLMSKKRERFWGGIITLIICGTAFLVDFFAGVPTSKILSVILYIVLGLVGVLILNVSMQVLSAMKFHTNDEAFFVLKTSGIAVLIIQSLCIIVFFTVGVFHVGFIVIGILYGLFFWFVFKENAIGP